MIFSHFSKVCRQNVDDEECVRTEQSIVESGDALFVGYMRTDGERGDSGKHNNNMKGK